MLHHLTVESKNVDLNVYRNVEIEVRVMVTRGRVGRVKGWSKFDQWHGELGRSSGALW